MCPSPSDTASDGAVTFNPILIRARNAGPMTGTGNNTYLITGADRMTLVDAGIGDAEHTAELSGHLVAHAKPLADVLVTHIHADHASGAPRLARLFQPRFAKYPWLEEDRRYDVEWSHLGDGDRVETGGHALTALHTPGHSPDHLAFWHAESGTLFSGDLVNPTGSVTVAWSMGGDMAAYLRSIQRLIELAPARLLPAHGPIVDRPGALLRATIDHRLRRESQVLDAVGRGLSTVHAITDSIYDGLDPALVPAARENVRAHLEKLEHEGIVTRTAPDRVTGIGWRLGPG